MNSKNDYLHSRAREILEEHERQRFEDICDEFERSAKKGEMKHGNPKLIELKATTISFVPLPTAMPDVLKTLNELRDRLRKV